MEKSELWPADNPAVTAHISMLQGIITRLAGASASCKTWCLALVGATLSFAAGTDTPRLAAFAVAPILIFLFLDTNYLAQERAYRDVHNAIVAKIRKGTYSRADAFNAKAPVPWGGLASAFVSWSVWPLYVGLVLALDIAAYNGWLDPTPGPEPDPVEANAQ